MPHSCQGLASLSLHTMVNHISHKFVLCMVQCAATEKRDSFFELMLYSGTLIPEQCMQHLKRGVYQRCCRPAHIHVIMQPVADSTKSLSCTNLA